METKSLGVEEEMGSHVPFFSSASACLEYCRQFSIVLRACHVFPRPLTLTARCPVLVV